MNQFRSSVYLLLLLSSQAFTASRQSVQRSGYTKLTSARVWSPPLDVDTFQLPKKHQRDFGVVDSIASTAASFILENFQSQQLPPTSQEKMYYLSRESLREIFMNDVRERNSLVTADFTTAIYEDTCRFKDGSGLDGCYSMKPWMLGCKMLFKGETSRANVLIDSLAVTSDLVSFRFESHLEFRGPFSPRVFLTGRITMERNPETGLISSYTETWDENVWDVVRKAQLQT